MSTEPDVVSTAPRPDRRAARRQETKDEIVAAAWELVRAQGLAGLAMRDLGERVGMKAQSIYSYFASKHEIYDAMFHEGYLAFAAAMAEVNRLPDDGTDDPRTAARRAAHRFFEFCTSDPVRYQLLFQRTIPDFVPSDDSYAVAVEVLEATRALVAAFGLTDPESLDLWTAMLTGLADQQISNDPGGDRWERIIDRAVDMFLREAGPDAREATTGRHDDRRRGKPTTRKTRR
jgi:AcrR family transcriptional regulator